MLTDSIRITAIPYASPAHAQEIALRTRVLRMPLGLTYTAEQLQAEEGQLHLGAWEGETLAGCLLVAPQAEGGVKFRQMAVAPEYQGRGIGHRLLAAAEAEARAMGLYEVTLHAREAVLGFYQKAGYHAVGERFYEVTLPHWAMVKSLR